MIKGKYSESFPWVQEKYAMQQYRDGKVTTDLDIKLYMDTFSLSTSK